MDRRTLLKLGASGLAVVAVGGGAWVQLRRRRDQRESDPIMGPWPALGPGSSWLLPSLEDARMVVPDRPHAHAEDDDPDTRKAIKRVRSFRVNTNAQRLRGPAFAAAPAEGVFRILAVGDSTTFGWGVEDSHAWPPLLEAELSARGHRVEVLNAGVPSLGFRGVAAYLRTQAPGLSPHAVIIGRRPDMQFSRSTFPGELRSIAPSLPGVRWMMAMPPISRFDPNGRRLWPTDEAEVSAALGSDPGVHVVELTPAFREAQGQRGHDLVERDGALHVVDLDSGETLLTTAIPERELPREIYDLFERDRGVAEPLIFDGGHPDAEGNALVARVLADRIEAQGWL